jgi:hypothetical protein
MPAKLAGTEKIHEQQGVEGWREEEGVGSVDLPISSITQPNASCLSFVPPQESPAPAPEPTGSAGAKAAAAARTDVPRVLPAAAARTRVLAYGVLMPTAARADVPTTPSATAEKVENLEEDNRKEYDERMSRMRHNLCSHESTEAQRLQEPQEDELGEVFLLLGGVEASICEHNRIKSGITATELQVKKNGYKFMFQLYRAKLELCKALTLSA